ncbi:hypothetical protein [Brevibacillus gelatini]|uniref:hypothetical protein n=1 Tax=Brevibacillus gelatini TaxID=1655277 RepID=UPI003D8189DC
MPEWQKLILYVAIISVLAEFVLGGEIEREEWDELVEALSMAGLEVADVFEKDQSVLLGLQKVCREFGKINIAEQLQMERLEEEQPL